MLVLTSICMQITILFNPNTLKLPENVTLFSSCLLTAGISLRKFSSLSSTVKAIFLTNVILTLYFFLFIHQLA